ncbi:MAG: PDZ domain-containing protein [Gammaproteobacteria bacterium]|nr:PDZ domain-containing protein [Gammaproteobacteria bacterium]
MKLPLPYPGLPLRVLLALSLLLAGCVSYESRQLVPSITLSPEDLELNTGDDSAGSTAGVDFGLQVTVNESDSLFNVEVLPGVRVREVTPGGPADMAGLQAGDVILRVNGTEVNEPDTLAALALQSRESSNFAFQLRRGTAVLEASVVARSRSATSAPLRELFRSDPLATRAGYETALLQVRDQGEISAARIVELAADSPLRAADLRINDVILAADGTPVQSAQGFINSMLGDYALGDSVVLSIYRDDEIMDRRIRLWDPGRRINRLSLRPLMFYESSQASQQSRFSLFDFWLFSVYSFNRSESEREHQLLGIFSVSSDYGELVEETVQP